MTHPAPGDVLGNIPHNGPHGATVVPSGVISNGGPEGPIPDYLEQFVVDQEIGRYTAQDQSVWRFVLLQLTDQLAHSAHPAYARGLAESGISVEHIPSIDEMNRALGAFGWRAVCVDGFIPPRAFQAFQALGILPIAAEIRSARQLPYTPAPDIIHEAAGHAPILVDPRYASYVREAGVVAARSFSNPADARLDRAVRRLSELKEQRSSPPVETRLAEEELAQAVLALGEPSEVARLSRLYWWTAEYGLIGTPREYRLYGAGLLSSLGESHFCQRAEVHKLPLTAACTQVGYDITRPQPQLFVARDFEHLHEVLGEVRRGLAQERGGLFALREAERSQELCTVHFAEGSQVIGTLAHTLDDERGLLLEFAPGAALVEHGRVHEKLAESYWVVAGRLSDGSVPNRAALEAACRREGHRHVQLRYACGAQLRGTLAEARGSSPSWVWLSDCRIEWPGRAPIDQPGPIPCLLSERPLGAHAGSSCSEVSPLGAQARAAGAPRPRVPRLKPRDAELERLNRLYARVARMNSSDDHLDSEALAGIVRELDAAYPEEWLLRWNALECLVRRGLVQGALARQLTARLEQLERHFAGEHPIGMGLRYLNARGSRPPPRKALP